MRKLLPSKCDTWILKIYLSVTFLSTLSYVSSFKDYVEYIDSLKDNDYENSPGFRTDEDIDYPWTWIDWTDINSEFHTKELIPDVVKKAPEDPVKVHYPVHPVDFGNVYYPLEFKRKPHRVKWKSVKGCFYTLIVTGPDCPTQAQPTKREWQHWLVVNIPGGDWQKGETLTEYAGVSALYKEGKHRIVYLVYQQPENKTIHFNEERLLARSSCNLKRSKFKTSKFVQKYKLGDPVGGNFCWLELGNRSPYFVYDDEDDFCRKIEFYNKSSWIIDLPKSRGRPKKTTLKVQVGTTKKPAKK